MDQVVGSDRPHASPRPPGESLEAELKALLAGSPGEQPTVRLHLWLEKGEEMYFGAGRAQLLFSIERFGSLKKAAQSMGMSYRAAWGKIQQSEQALGLKLVESRGSRREGVELTTHGRALAELYRKWFAAVEQAALVAAQDIFPFHPRQFEDGKPLSPPG